MASHTIRAAVSRNALPCTVPGCYRPREGVSLTCQRHRKAKRVHGHPLGRSIRKSEYAWARKDVAALVKRNRSHPGIAHVIEGIDDWLTESVNGRPRCCAHEMARLAEHGVTGEDVLVECAAIWAHSRFQPRTLPDDDRLSFALGNAVLGLAPLPARERYSHAKGRAVRQSVAPRNSARESIGRGMRTEFALLFESIARHLEESREAAAKAKRDRAEAMFAPLDTPGAP